MTKRLDWKCEMCDKFGSIHHPNLPGPLLFEVLEKTHRLESPHCYLWKFRLVQDGIPVIAEVLTLTEEDFRRGQEAERLHPYPC